MRRLAVAVILGASGTAITWTITQQTVPAAVYGAAIATVVWLITRHHDRD